MEKLNEYLQSLLSTCGYELHLEPNKIPFVVASGGTNNVANAPLLGTQISTMIFPLIPNEVKRELPNKTEVEFSHVHNLGEFSFRVKKSPAGFLVTICPLLANPAVAANEISSEPLDARTVLSEPPTRDTFSVFTNPPPQPQTQTVTFENVAAPQYDPGAQIPEIIYEETPAANHNDEIFDTVPQIEIISANDPEFVTTFSDTSTYEPPGRAYDYVSEIAPAAQQHQQFAPPQTFAPETVYAETQLPPQPPESFSPPTFQTPSFQMPPNFPAAQAAFVAAAVNPQMRARMDDLFRQMAHVGASDLHLAVSMPPMIRHDGKMRQLQNGEAALTPDMMRELLVSIMPAKNQEEFSERHDTDFAYEIQGLARFRANIFMDRKGMGGVFRIIPTKILTAEQLGLSKAIMDLCSLSKGLVVVTGPTGSGKSTTLCAMVDHINKDREDHIITIEDPIEFTHENQKCLVNQREVHNHTDSFKDALRAALREDPDILLVGEMRDLETISIAIETAETGHLVFGTLHTTTAASTIDRIIDQFPADRQQQIRVMLSESLRGVIAQTLLPKKGGGRVAALEILIVTPAISNLIREGKTFQIPSAIQTGKQHGMVMLNEALINLVMKGLVEPRDAYIKAVDKTGFDSLLQRNGLKI